MKKKTLNDIADKYRNLEVTPIYHVGGGISNEKYVSKRYERADNDPARLRLSQFINEIYKVTKTDKSLIERITHNIFDLEWHHAGRYISPSGKKAMRRIYFINAKQICYFCDNFERIVQTYNEIIDAKEQMKNLEIEYGTWHERITEKPEYFITKYEEMHGKYGWFERDDRYNLPVYYSGYSLPENIYNKYNELQSLIKQKLLSIKFV